MADNRMYLVHEPSGLAIMIGKRHGWDYFPSMAIEHIDDFYAAIDLSYGSPDQMRIGFEHDELYAEGENSVDNEIEFLATGGRFERVKFLNRHLETDTEND